MKDRQVAHTSTDKFLIDAQGLLVVIRGLGAGSFNITIDSSPDAVLQHAEHLGNGRYRQLPGQGQYHDIHQQGEAATESSSEHLDLSDLAAVPALHPQHRGMQKGLELKETQMLPSPAPGHEWVG